LFLVVAYTAKNGWTYLIDQYIKRRVFSQGIAVWDLDDDRPSLGVKTPKNENFGMRIVISSQAKISK